MEDSELNTGETMIVDFKRLCEKADKSESDIAFILAELATIQSKLAKLTKRPECAKCGGNGSVPFRGDQYIDCPACNGKGF